MDSAMLQKQVQAYWDGKPCDSEFSTEERHSRAYYAAIEQERYRLQSHILQILDRVDWRGKKVLEIGTGVGTDARRMIGGGQTTPA